jgi:hypothetical protein
MASLLNGTIECGQGRTGHGAFARSGRERRRAGLRMRASPGTEQVGCRAEPDYTRHLPPRRRNGSLRRINRCAGLDHAANRTAVVGTLAGLIGLTRCRAGVAVANGGGMKRVGRSDAGGPRCPDWRKNLRQHRNQDDRNKLSQPPAHQTTSPSSLIKHARSSESSCVHQRFRVLRYFGHRVSRESPETDATLHGNHVSGEIPGPRPVGREYAKSAGVDPPPQHNGSLRASVSLHKIVSEAYSLSRRS